MGYRGGEVVQRMCVSAVLTGRREGFPVTCSDSGLLSFIAAVHHVLYKFFGLNLFTENPFSDAEPPHMFAGPQRGKYAYTTCARSFRPALIYSVERFVSAGFTGERDYGTFIVFFFFYSNHFPIIFDATLSKFIFIVM